MYIWVCVGPRVVMLDSEPHLQKRSHNATPHKARDSMQHLQQGQGLAEHQHGCGVGVCSINTLCTWTER